MDLTEIRRLVVIAMFSDDFLLDRLVLKGGNALELVHGIVSRGSVDVDFSVQEDFGDWEDAQRRIKRALQDRFDSSGYEVFDVSFRTIPQQQKGPWGGYAVEFKVISKKQIDAFRRKYPDGRRRLEQMRREAHLVGPNQQRTFKIEISRHEFCATKVERTLDDYTIYVYTPEMIAIEKLRAICQQMPEYKLRKKQIPRARDFFDVHAILTHCDIDLARPESIALLRSIFAAKEVPLVLLTNIESQREFHRPDWPAVANAVLGSVRSFDFYFEYVVGMVCPLVRTLQTLGIIDSPT